MYNDRNQREFARNLRRNLTDAEGKLWSLLRCKQLRGHKFRRQAAIGNFVVDFVSFSDRLIVELDGGQHNTDQGKEYDALRTRWLNEQGFRVIRFWNHDVLENTEGVVEVIWNALQVEGLQQGLPPSPALPAEGRE